MLNSFYEIKDDIIRQADISTTVAFITDAILDDWLDNAHKWAAGYKKWTVTEGRINTTYVADDTSIEVGFNYPENWKPDSIRFLTVGGKRFKKTNFYKYQAFREDFNSSQDKICSDFGSRYYINPRADASGTTTLWGQFMPADWDFTDNTAKTVFSGTCDEANHAIVEKVLADIKRKQKNLNEALEHEKKAKEILLEKLQQIQEEQFGYQDHESDGMFKRIDVIQGDFYSDIVRRNRWY